MFYIDNDLDTVTRFDTMKFMNFDVDNIDPLTSFMIYNIPLLRVQGTRKITTEELRPDMLSYNIYKDTQYWWILLIYNNILDINELIPGKIIAYPSLSHIEYLYERASLLEKTK